MHSMGIAPLGGRARPGPNLPPVQRDFGGAQPINGRLAAPRHTLLFASIRNRPMPSAIALIAGAGAQRSVVGGVAVGHRSSSRVEHVNRRHFSWPWLRRGQVVARLRLGMGEGEQQNRRPRPSEGSHLLYSLAARRTNRRRARQSRNRARAPGRGRTFPSRSSSRPGRRRSRRALRQGGLRAGVLSECCHFRCYSRRSPACFSCAARNRNDPR